jgi:hypothetical protein
MQSIKISSLCVFGEKLGKGSVNLAFIPVIKPNMVYVQRPMALKPLLYSYDTFVLSNLVTSDMYFSGIAL